jgi:transposase-like protein
MDEEIRRHIISLYYQYTSVREIARVTGITVKQVTRIVAPFMDERHRKQGRSARPVAIPAKHRIGQVNDRQRLKCLSCGRRFCPSATSGTNTALPPETVSSVVAKYHAFMPRKEIAVRCGLTVKAVSEILKPYRHTRIHVMCPRCSGLKIYRWGKVSGGLQKYRCRECGRVFSQNPDRLTSGFTVSES